MTEYTYTVKWDDEREPSDFAKELFESLKKAKEIYMLPSGKIVIWNKEKEIFEPYAPNSTIESGNQEKSI